MAFNVVSSTTTLILLLCALSLARATNCGSSNFTTNGPYSRSLASLLSSLPHHAFSSLYYSANSTATTSLDTAYAMFQCRGDLTLSECSACVSSAINETVQACPSSIAAQDLEDQCTLMYQNETITANSFTLEIYAWNTDNNSDSTFRSNRDTALAIVSKAAPYQGDYNSTYVGNTISEGVYALAQCSGYLSKDGCAQCLSQVTGVQRLIGNQVGARVNFGTNCYYRFETYLFYNNTLAPVPSPPVQPAPVPKPPAATNSPTGVRVSKPILIGAILGLCLLLVVCCTLLGLWKRESTRKDGQALMMSLPETPRGSTGQHSIELQADFQHQVRLFSLEELAKATRNFDDENKLGEGGFGSVYKGVLENGQFVAIKKLSHPGHQGEHQFLSEVKLLTTVQHRNLIMLVGCCMEGSQRLLIYEYVPNQSLDKHLFDADRSASLNWNIRRQIILGTAKGLAYLHEDSQVRIVHRDIKAANILLDDNLHPKIADFGLARLFAADQTHTTTMVAGTRGYLAPEYAIHGQLTEKADIFSYGIVVLEILSGRTITDSRLSEDRDTLLQWTWKLYLEQRHLELMDPLLGENYFAEEAIRMVHVALLCTQAVAGLRPAMSKIVMLLMGRSEILDIPTSPPLMPNSVAGLGLQTASGDDQQGVRMQAPWHSSDTSSVYSPLMSHRSQALVFSISDVPECR